MERRERTKVDRIYDSGCNIMMLQLSRTIIYYFFISRAALATNSSLHRYRYKMFAQFSIIYCRVVQWGIVECMLEQDSINFMVGQQQYREILRTFSKIIQQVPTTNYLSHCKSKVVLFEY